MYATYVLSMGNLFTENVQDYPRPPVVEPVDQKLMVRLGGQIVADSNDGLRVLETHHAPTYYIPRADVVADLVAAKGQSYCEWKGIASYFDVHAGTITARKAAWTYEEPNKEFTVLEGHIAFYAGLMEACYVGADRVVPQPGDFYGGWVTSNLKGIPKGARGTEHW